MTASESALPDGELHEYVEAFRTSSDRARTALYVVVVATALVAIATYNLRPGGWPLSRLSTWYRYAPAAASASTVPGAHASATSHLTDDQVPPWLFGGDAERLRIAREEYLKLFIARAVLTDSPIPGVWLDVNDLGLVGGVGLALLMLVLLFCILREHENLYLALYKVRSLADQGDPSRGDSKANLLYHALAMRQVLASPPTLARWRRRGVLIPLWWIVFFAPGITSLWVLLANVLTLKRGKAYGVDVDTVLFVQVALTVLLFLLGLCALTLSYSMGRRWRSAFYSVNPTRRLAPQATLWEWLGLRRGRSWRKIQKRLATELVESFGRDDEKGQATEAPEVEAEVEHSLRLSADFVRARERDEMAGVLERKGTGAAEDRCREHGTALAELSRFRASSNQVLEIDGERLWRVRGSWTYSTTGDQGDGARRG